jgi:peroxiredoxin Q/BCP
MISEGSLIPDFELFDQNGKLFKCGDLLGNKNMVIFFYPKDETSGCTAEACSFRDSYEELVGLGAEIIGISSDSEQSHQSFAKNHRLPYILLSDPQEKVRNLFGVPKSLFGLIPGRTTFVVDKTGTVIKRFNSQFSPVRHVREAILALESINRN